MRMGYESSTGEIYPPWGHTVYLQQDCWTYPHLPQQALINALRQVYTLENEQSGSFNPLCTSVSYLSQLPLSLRRKIWIYAIGDLALVNINIPLEPLRLLDILLLNKRVLIEIITVVYEIASFEMSESCVRNDLHIGIFETHNIRCLRVGLDPATLDATTSHLARSSGTRSPYLDLLDILKEKYPQLHELTFLRLACSLRNIPTILSDVSVIERVAVAELSMLNLFGDVSAVLTEYWNPHIMAEIEVNYNDTTTVKTNATVMPPRLLEATNVRPPPRLSLLGLPPEVRVLIWGYVIPDVLKASRIRDRWPRRDPVTLFGVCQQIYAEVVPRICEQSLFVLEDWTLQIETQKWARGPFTQSKVRNLRVGSFYNDFIARCKVFDASYYDRSHFMNHRLWLKRVQEAMPEIQFLEFCDSMGVRGEFGYFLDPVAQDLIFRRDGHHPEPAINIILWGTEYNELFSCFYQNADRGSGSSLTIYLRLYDGQSWCRGPEGPDDYVGVVRLTRSSVELVKWQTCELQRVHGGVKELLDGWEEWEEIPKTRWQEWSEIRQ